MKNVLKAVWKHIRTYYWLHLCSTGIVFAALQMNLSAGMWALVALITNMELAYYKKWAAEIEDGVAELTSVLNSRFKDFEAKV